jgi:integrase/recombinase XerD
MDAMIAAATAQAQKNAEGKRLLAIVEMLYAAGLRVSELAGLPLARVKGKDGFVLVAGKGGKERLAPLNPSARAAIKSYLDVRAEFLPKNSTRARAVSFLFARQGGFLTRQRLHQLLKGLALKAGSIPPRSRRMCCATPSPPIWWKAAPICAACRRFWAMPTSPPPKSTPMSPRTI